jgi:predicted dehydrogenase
MKDTVGIGIIGTGFARKVQIPAFQACEKAKIVSVASGSIGNARSTAEHFGIEHFTDDWRQTVTRDDVDLVCITTPPSLHREMTLAAIDNGKHVLCEKPMAMNAGEAREMTDRANDSNVIALIDFELRFQPGRRKAYDMIRDGEIGKVRHAKYYFQAPHRGDPTIEWDWWSDESEGGGALGAIASHVIDSFRWLLRAEVADVFCQLQTHIKRRPRSDGEMRDVTSDDEALLILRFGNSDLTDDATGLVSVSMTEFPSYRNRIEFYGSDGAMAVEQRGEVFVAKTGDSDWRSIDVSLGDGVPGVPDTGFSRGFVEFAPRLVDTISKGERTLEHAATFADGFAVQHVLDAARESNRTQRIVSLD